MFKKLVILAIALVSLADATAQESQNSGVRRRDASDRRDGDRREAGVTDRMQQHYSEAGQSLSEGDVQWMRVVYRELDLDKDTNAPLYFPEEPVDGEENFFRIIMRLLGDGRIKAYEYLDGRELFTDDYVVKMRDVYDRFHIYATEAKGSTEKAPRYEVADVDLPANEVLFYYIVERWTFDTRQNRMRTTVEAVCPVLYRSGDYGGDRMKYPMFWVKYSDLRPYLAQQQIFISDDNNLPTCSYDDFFTLNMYEGDIYKTRNLRNKSMMQLYPDPEDMKRAQDSIQQRLVTFEDKLWVPDREEIIAAREAREAAMEAGADSLGGVLIAPDGDDQPRSVRSTARGSKSTDKKQPKQKDKKVKQSKPKSAPVSTSSSATRSVRRKK